MALSDLAESLAGSPSRPYPVMRSIGHAWEFDRSIWPTSLSPHIARMAEKPYFRGGKASKPDVSRLGDHLAAL